MMMGETLIYFFRRRKANQSIRDARALEAAEFSFFILLPVASWQFVGEYTPVPWVYLEGIIRGCVFSIYESASWLFSLCRQGHQPTSRNATILGKIFCRSIIIQYDTRGICV